MTQKPSRIEPRFVERVWGRTDLSPWFPASENKIGEVWFQTSETSPLLIKLIYTTEKLSVQVHPDDEYARLHHSSRGKTEMWHVLAAEPGAVIGLGLREHITRERLREAALSGEIERLINWVEAHPGDTFYVEAGTIHAIGAGLTVCEIQQNSDVTYRLYDYGRRRELHLDHGVTVASCEPYYGRVRLPLDCDFFLTEELRWTGQHTYRSAGPGEHFLIVLEGSGTMEGEAFTAGEVWSVPENAAFAVVPSEPVRVLRTKPPV